MLEDDEFRWSLFLTAADLSDNHRGKRFATLPRSRRRW